ncbi:flagellar protein FlgN [Fusibacter sp. JL298sf-3]
MSRWIDQLVQTLNKETEIYHDVLKLSIKKREAIRTQDIKMLEKVTGEEQALVVTLFKLEEIREKVTDGLMQEMGIDAVDTLDQLGKFMLPDDRERVQAAKTELFVVLKNVTDENKFNNKMMEDKLEWIQLNLDLLTSVSDDSGKYDKDAVNDTYERKNIFDARV